MKSLEARFHIGQVVYNKQFDYRGVVIDVDSSFKGMEEWYKKIAVHRPPKNEPWYHILVHEAAHRIYTAESTLMADNSGEPINHPDLDYFFSEFRNGVYISRRNYNV